MWNEPSGCDDRRKQAHMRDVMAEARFGGGFDLRFLRKESITRLLISADRLVTQESMWALV